MAAAGSVQGEKGAEENEDSSVRIWPTISELCRKNGISASYECSENSCKTIDTKLTKYNCIVKINNGLRSLTAKQSAVCGSIHLRPRVRARRLTNPHTKKDATCLLRENSNQANSLNNNEECSQLLSVMASENEKNKTDGDSRDLINHRNNKLQSTTKCDNKEKLVISLNNPTSVFQENGVGDIKMTNGFRNRLRNGVLKNGEVLNGHVTMSPPINGCRIELVRSLNSLKHGSSSSTSSITSETDSTKAAAISRSNSAEVKVTDNQDSSDVSSSGFQDLFTKPELCRMVSRTPSGSSTTSQASTIEKSQRSSYWLPPFLHTEHSSSSTNSLCSFSSRDGVNSDAKSNTATKSTVCKWSKCNLEMETSQLMDHLQINHIAKQDGETFCCLWIDCKVYNKSSSSRKWLERHVLTHSGDKPFKCIVDKCGMQFTSQYGLERHVNSHFNMARPNGCKSMRTKEDTPSKLAKKKKIKRKRTPPVKTDDYFDQRCMEGIHRRLYKLSQASQIDILGSNNHITFHSSVIARRRDPSNEVHVLLRWSPENILSDTWVPESQVHKMSTQVRSLSELPPEDVLSLDPTLYVPHRYRRHRRK